MQGYLRNPLAEPSVLGASNMAALGAVIAFYFGLALIHPLLLPLMAVAGAIIALAPLMLLARRAESPLGLILAGLAISPLAGAGISLALNLAPNPFAAMEILTWLLGSLAIGSASCRERVCPYGLLSVVAGSLKKKNKKTTTNK